ncbi:NIPA 2 [Lecanosticta acicola]|uniref:NIPA 2 n=1 Tax=Lecanosticta acicola TaxID=111012 RepID=A0AAI8YW72_9PEZI|nr:NIPA 2 [Lecanosticta acicola]
MYLPTSYDPTSTDVPTISAFGGKSKLKNGDWASLIGVITAIVGNILISFALNTQRYAHMRLGRDREEGVPEKRKAARRKATSNSNYGTQQAAIAEDRARQNAKAEENEQSIEENGETQPLIPRLDSGRTTSGSFGDTVPQEENDEDASKETSYLKSPIWWLGISLMVLGEAGNFLAYGFAPASIVSPLGVVALISNCIIAPLLLGEHFRYRDGFGVVVAIAGCVVVVLSASANNPKLTPEAIWDLVTTWEFETYLGITCFLIIVLLFLSNKYGHKTILIDLGLVGLFGGYTALSTKGVSSLLTYSIWRIVTFPITYLLLAVLVVTAIMQIKYVNRALQRFNATQVIPTQFVLFTLSVILGSAVLYRDFESEKAEDGIKFVAGCGLTFFGVYCITSGPRPGDDKDDEEDLGEEEDAIGLVDEETAPETREMENPTRQSSLAVASSSGGSLRRLNTAGDTSIPRSVNASAMESDLGTSPSAPLDSNAQPIKQQLEDVAPANVSAVHIESSAPLLAEHTGDPKKKPAIHATTSEPVVPTTPTASNALRPKTPLDRTPSGPAGVSPSRPSPSRTHLDPGASRQRLTARHSVGGLLPGPLTSPLSGSLSAIVADELRRGIDKSPSGSLSRRRKTPTPATTRRPTDQQLQLAMNRPAASSGLKRHSIANGEPGLASEDDTAVRVAAGSPKENSGRVRSLSATLTDMFGASGSNVSMRSSRKTREPNAQEERRQRTLDAAFGENEAPVHGRQQGDE